MMQNGWALQSGTSHFLGQNFAKAFDVKIENEHNELDMFGPQAGGLTRLIKGCDHGSLRRYRFGTATENCWLRW